MLAWYVIAAHMRLLRHARKASGVMPAASACDASSASGPVPTDTGGLAAADRRHGAQKASLSRCACELEAAP